MPEKIIEQLEICLDYLKRIKHIQNLIESESRQEAEIRENIEYARQNAPEDVKEFQSYLDDLPNIKQRNRNTLYSLYRSPGHRLIQKLLPENLACEDAIEELISILLMGEASTLEEAASVLRQQKTALTDEG